MWQLTPRKLEAKQYGSLAHWVSSLTMFLSPGPLLLTLTFKGIYKPHYQYADVTRDYK